MNRPGRGISLKHVLWVAVGTVIVGLASHFLDRSPVELTFLKVVMVPVIFAAIDGSDWRYDFEEAYRRWSPAFLQRIAITSLVSAGGVTFLLARPESELPGLTFNFIMFFVLFSVISVFGPHNQRPRSTEAETK